jgi:hypothetical protein
MGHQNDFDGVDYDMPDITVDEVLQPFNVRVRDVMSPRGACWTYEPASNEIVQSAKGLKEGEKIAVPEKGDAWLKDKEGANQAVVDEIIKEDQQVADEVNKDIKTGKVPVPDRLPPPVTAKQNNQASSLSSTVLTFIFIASIIISV